MAEFRQDWFRRKPGKGSTWRAARRWRPA